MQCRVDDIRPTEIDLPGGYFDRRPNDSVAVGGVDFQFPTLDCMLCQNAEYVFNVSIDCCLRSGPCRIYGSSFGGNSAVRGTSDPDIE